MQISSVLASAIFFCFLGTVHSAIHPDGRTVVDQNLICHAGQAISDVWWFKEAKTYNSYFFECENVTESCQEVC